MNKKGFSLPEVLAVIIILGILLLVAVPSVTKLSQSVEKRKIKNDAKTFIALAKEYVETSTILGESNSYTVSLNNIQKDKLNGKDYNDNSYVKANSCSFSGMRFKCNSFNVKLGNSNYCVSGVENSLGISKGECHYD